MLFTMRSHLLSLLVFTSQSLAVPYNLQSLTQEGPAPSLQDVATVGFATMNGGTTGGKGGPVVHVSTYEAFAAAVKGNEPKIVVVSGTISKQEKTRVGSNKSIIGKPGAHLIGNGFFISKQKNVIIRNLKISKVQADNGDAIGLQNTNNVWIDHVDVSSDLNNGKDYYDGLIDITHACDFVTVSNSYMHDHFKASLVGHSDNNESEDRGHLRVTYFNNYWYNINSRAPSLRFGTGHIFDSVFVNVNDGINVRKGAQVLVQQNSFVNSSKPLYTVDSTGGAVQMNNDFGTSKVVAMSGGRLSSVPYQYEAAPIEQLKTTLPKIAGATLSF